MDNPDLEILETLGTQDTRRKQTQHRKQNRWATQTPPITDRNITSIYRTCVITDRNITSIYRTCSIFDRNNNIYS